MTILYARGKNMKWNLSKIKFLYPPDNFIGSFANEKMQARHKALQDEKINNILKNLGAAENPLTAMQTLNNLDLIQFLLNNIEEFREHECLEETVLKLYCRQNSAFASGERMISGTTFSLNAMHRDFTDWEHLFQIKRCLPIEDLLPE